MSTSKPKQPIIKPSVKPAVRSITVRQSAAAPSVASTESWIPFQKAVFTRWANERLKTSKTTSAQRIKDLQKDLSDGILLIALVEALSGSKLPGKRHLKPTSRTQKLENVSVCLCYLVEQQEVKIVNIASSDVVDGKLKLIIALMWTLILHYSISSRSWKSSATAVLDSVCDSSPRQELLDWINGRLPEDRKVRNFTRDWNDGKTLAALVSSFDIGLCGDWRQWNDKDCIRNIVTAMRDAKKSLKIAELMTSEEMCDARVDEQCIMTYLSQFPNTLSSRPNGDYQSRQSRHSIVTTCMGVAGVLPDLDTAVSSQKPHPDRDKVAFNADLVRACGNGLSTGYVGHPVKFAVTGEDEPNAAVSVSVRGPANVRFIRRKIENGYEYEYTTTVAGSYNVSVLYGGEMPVAGSPFAVNFSKLTNKYNVKVFTSHVIGAGTDANVFIVLIGEIGETANVPLKSSKMHANKFEQGQCDEFTVEAYNIGELRKIRIGHDGSGAGADWHLDSVVIDLPSQPRKWTFKLNQWIGKESPGGLEQEILPTKDAAGDEPITSKASQPKQSIPREEKFLKTGFGFVRAVGDGLKAGYVGKPARFTVTSNQTNLPQIEVSVRGPAAAGNVKLRREEVNGNGFEYEYVASVEGSYIVTILDDRKLHVPGSPFKANITHVTYTYHVNVFTSHVVGAGTDANVYIVLVGETEKTAKIPLKTSKTHANKFERGQCDKFIINTNYIGELRKIRIGHDGSGAGADWHLDSVVIDLPSQHRKWTFKLNQWIGKESAGGLEHEILPTKVARLDAER